MSDFDVTTVEAMCTPLDIRLKHRLFTYEVVSDAILYEACIQARAIIELGLNRFYTTLMLRGAAYHSQMHRDAIWTVPDEFKNDEVSFAFDATEKVGFRGITVVDADTTYTQHYRLEFSSATAYAMSAYIEGSQGSASDLTSAFTSTNADITIDADSDFGTFEKDHGYQFSVYRWYREVVMIATWIATSIAMIDHYGEDQEDVLSTAKSYAKQALTFLKRLNDPDNDLMNSQHRVDGLDFGLRLPSLGPRTLGAIARPYDVSFTGHDLTKIAASNLGSSGERGEQLGTFDVFVSQDDSIIFGF